MHSIHKGTLSLKIDNIEHKNQRSSLGDNKLKEPKDPLSEHLVGNFAYMRAKSSSQIVMQFCTGIDIWDVITLHILVGCRMAQISGSSIVFRRHPYNTLATMLVYYCNLLLAGCKYQSHCIFVICADNMY